MSCCNYYTMDLNTLKDTYYSMTKENDLSLGNTDYLKIIYITVVVVSLFICLLWLFIVLLINGVGL